MTYSDIEYLADSMLMEAFLRDSSMTKLAQNSLVSSMAQTIKEYVLSEFQNFKNDPVAGAVSFLGPGLVWKVSPMLGVLYEVAAALGFDWPGFWRSVINNLKEFLSVIFSSGQKPTEEALTEKTNAAVDAAGQEYFKDNPDQGMLESLKKKYQSITARSQKNSLKDVIELKAVARKYQKDKKIIKNASLTSKLFGFFMRVLKWLIKTALISLGLTAAGGAAATLLGTKPVGQPGESSSGVVGTEDEPSAPSGGMISIPMSGSVSPDLMEWHQNDMRSSWLEHGEINSVPELVLSWIVNAYPQLNSYQSDIYNSSSFRTVLNRFLSRNRLAQGMGIFSVPRPFQRKIDIVNQIVSGFLQEHGSVGQRPGQPAQADEIDYK